MNNIIIFIFSLFLFNFSWGQSLCPPNDITTNPVNPVNTQKIQSWLNNQDWIFFLNIYLE
ncbi:MAG: hypothetical protein ACJAT4_002436 [Granulosicoccus sp.]|jgi:hypothetical protein